MSKVVYCRRPTSSFNTMNWNKCVIKRSSKVNLLSYINLLIKIEISHT